ncbi:hypothetical protein L1D26_23145 [Vibrio mediterranei]|uniref:hypothetical protein n=1 Tax=Vibrio mediterranei TaxID=689 RepID=UPI001EFD87E0|nr:hypothetical protein [Vibrio mediterranei]MCG9665953.1 hypothetical protein [Vibrio mediterranei]
MKKGFLSIRMVGCVITIAIIVSVALSITLAITTLVDVVVVMFQAREERFYKFIDETQDCQLQEKVSSPNKLPTRLVYDCDGVLKIWEK